LRENNERRSIAALVNLTDADVARPELVLCRRTARSSARSDDEQFERGVLPAGSCQFIQAGEELAPPAGSAITSRWRPVIAAGETTDAARARPKPPLERAATAMVNAFKRQQGILRGMSEYREFDELIMIAS
jgi:hypothetical protein